MKLPVRCRVRPITGLLAAAILVSGCDIRIGNDVAGVTERVEKTFTVTGVPDVTLRTFDGSVEIRAWDRPEVFVDVEKRAADRPGLEAIAVVASQEGGRISLEARRPRPKGGDIITIGIVVSPAARIVASVPRRVDLTVASGDGSIVVERVSGRLELRTDDGLIRGTDVAGEITAWTGDGSVQLDGIEGRADVETADGGVRISGRLDRLRVRTGDGSIRARIEPSSVMSEDWEIRTSDGSVTLELPPDFSAEIDAASGGGRVVVDGFDLGVGPRSGRRAVRGVVGSGGRLLRLRTGDGTIRIVSLQRGAGDR